MKSPSQHLTHWHILTTVRNTVDLPRKFPATLPRWGEEEILLPFKDSPTNGTNGNIIDADTQIMQVVSYDVFGL